MPIRNDSDRDWEMWANQNPYYGVLSAPQFLAENLDEESLKNFFQSGERHIEHVFSVIREKIKPDFHPDSVLDYGIGVGRLLIPLAQRSKSAFGIDISPSMLKLARENCEKSGISSAIFVHANDLDKIPQGSLNLIHSSLVFQHIPTERGEVIFRKLVALLTKGGVGSIHLNYADTRGLLRRSVSSARRNLDIVHRLLNVMQGRPISAPMMQMNNYSMNRIFDILVDENCGNTFVEFSEDKSHRAATLYFEKS